MSEKVGIILEMIVNLNQNDQKELMSRLAEIMQSLNSSCGSKITQNSISNLNAVIACPYCTSSAIQNHANFNNRMRYKCMSCLKTFTKLTGSSISKTRYPEKWQSFIGCMVDGLSVARTAVKVGVSIPTAFSWRHKLLKQYEKEAGLTLAGIIEADETFFLFSEKGSKGVSAKRKPRKRGGKAKKSGISNEQIPVIVGCDRNGNVIIGVAGAGRISLADIELTLNEFMAGNSTLCTDGHASFKAYAKAYQLNYIGLNISKGRRVVEDIYHIQNVNNFHSRLKQWMMRFNGVSTKYLQNYMNWFALLEETKGTKNEQCAEFTKRSLPALIT
jgi:transposase-like protein